MGDLNPWFKARIIFSESWNSISEPELFVRVLVTTHRMYHYAVHNLLGQPLNTVSCTLTRADQQRPLLQGSRSVDNHAGHVFTEGHFRVQGLEVVVGVDNWFGTIFSTTEIKMCKLYVGWVITEMIPVETDFNLHHYFKHDHEDGVCVVNVVYLVFTVVTRLFVSQRSHKT